MSVKPAGYTGPCAGSALYAADSKRTLCLLVGEFGLFIASVGLLQTGLPQDLPGARGPSTKSRWGGGAGGPCPRRAGSRHDFSARCGAQSTAGSGCEAGWASGHCKELRDRRAGPCVTPSSRNGDPCASDEPSPFLPATEPHGCPPPGGSDLSPMVLATRLSGGFDRLSLWFSPSSLSCLCPLLPPPPSPSSPSPPPHPSSPLSPPPPPLLPQDLV